MAALAKAVQISKSVNNVTKLLTNLSLTPNVKSILSPIRKQWIPSSQYALIHTTLKQNDLMEFFDNKDNWGKTSVKVGRSWRKDELRLKSNEDLHKLWFVLLKEYNMLLTMEQAYKEKFEYFPNPERIDKILNSMSNVESVVRERNQAYYKLETGTTGERPAQMSYNALGLRYFYRMSQYSVPKYMNTRWHKRYMFGYGGYAVQKFLRLYREKLYNIKRRQRNRETNRVGVLMRMFPNLDLEAAKEQYPGADIEKLMKMRKVDGHFQRE
ncbi:39S ribosomal protein L47, mitochondrial [Hylaeus volcanicus]|uniref:39S ribosomal protein L47, mitochondrial n=1 Tax=Hylaeus volcanicus TaxID=313075 RepID=UPI0023B792E8|nr:39S ribosomal protein L47, mitochondrial [Hylaeus volcanicus]